MCSEVFVAPSISFKTCIFHPVSSVSVAVLRDVLPHFLRCTLRVESTGAIIGRPENDWLD